MGCESIQTPRLLVIQLSDGRDIKSWYFLPNSVRRELFWNLWCFPDQTCIFDWECLFTTADTSLLAFLLQNRSPASPSEEQSTLKVIRDIFSALSKLKGLEPAQHHL